MRKLFVALLAIPALFGLVACSNEPVEGNATPVQADVDTVKAERAERQAQIDAEYVKREKQVCVAMNEAVIDGGLNAFELYNVSYLTGQLYGLTDQDEIARVTVEIIQSRCPAYLPAVIAVVEAWEGGR